MIVQPHSPRTSRGQYRESQCQSMQPGLPAMRTLDLSGPLSPLTNKTRHISLFIFFSDRVTCSPSCPGTHYIVQAGLELRDLSPECWDDRPVPLHSATRVSLTSGIFQSQAGETHIFNPSPRDTEAGGSLSLRLRSTKRLPGQPGLHRETLS